MSTKQKLYAEAKSLALRLNIKAPEWLGSSIVSLRNCITINTRRRLPFLDEITQTSTLRRVDFPFFEFLFLKYYMCSFGFQMLLYPYIVLTSF